MRLVAWIPGIAGVLLALVAGGGCSTTAGPSAGNDPFAAPAWHAACPGGATYGARGPCGPPTLSVY